MWVLIGVGAALLICIGYKHMHHYGVHDKEAMHHDEPQAGHYVSEHVGVMFDYPTKYIATSTHAGDGHVIVLLPADYVPPINGEGPATITVSQFSNANDLPLEQFIRNEPRANFGLSDGQTTSTQVGGHPALAYNYSGLYESDGVAVAVHNKIFIFATGWYSPTDSLRQELKDLLQTVVFIEEHDHAH